MAGVSRSVTLVIAHLIRKTGKPFEDIFLQIKSRRKIVNIICNLRYAQILHLSVNSKDMKIS